MKCDGIIVSTITQLKVTLNDNNHHLVKQLISSLAIESVN